METPKSYRTSVLPDLSRRGVSTESRPVVDDDLVGVGRTGPRVTVRSGTTLGDVRLDLRILPPQG